MGLALAGPPAGNFRANLAEATSQPWKGDEETEACRKESYGVSTITEKLEKYLFYLLLFSIPFQARKILWYEGWRFMEWQSISIYMTDLILVCLFLFWICNKLKMKNEKVKITVKNLKFYEYFLILFLVISAVSVKNSSSYLISWFQCLKLLEFVAFFFYLKNYALAKIGLYNSFFSIFIGGLLQSIIAVSQFLKQESLGLWFLGESIFNKEILGVASFYLPNGEKIIRAYGTTPHPNVLATYIFLAIFSFYFIYLYSRLHKEHDPMLDDWDKSMLWLHGLLLFAFLTTFSRAIIFIWFVSFCGRTLTIRLTRSYRLSFGTPEGRKRIKAILLVSLCVLVIFGSLYFNEIKTRLAIHLDDQAVELRTFYIGEVFKNGFNLFGVGIGNFVGWMVQNRPNLPTYAYQPVHNIYLLVYSETGILGTSFFILFLVFVIRGFILKTGLKKSYHLSFLVFFCSLLFVGLFDHLLMTLQQGGLIFWGSLRILTFLSNDDIM